MGFSQNEIILQAFRRGKSIGLRLSASEIILSYSLGIGEYVDETKWGAFIGWISSQNAKLLSNRPHGFKTTLFLGL